MRLPARPVLLVLLLALVLPPPTAAPVEPSRAVSLPTGGTVLLGGRVTVRVEVAVTDKEHTRGLSGRPALQPGTGMLFAYPAPGLRSMWMMGMRFPLDFLWIRDGRIVDLFERVPPPRPGEQPVTVASPEPAQYILELPGGSIRAHGLGRGDAAVIRLDRKSP
ncbi:MAG: DUF192 domain-containing protein [Candidatus Methylomirabilales bacterium]